jgi:predicted glycoside hydrolase/deacetylase ChbG (UPF0249 family)
MPMPSNIIVNADDLGANPLINKAILLCFEKEYINSACLLANTEYFEETVQLIQRSNCIKNIGVHINLAEGKPLTDFTVNHFLDESGNWRLAKTNRIYTILNKKAKKYFLEEICLQIDKVIDAGITATHMDSHYHLHTLPCFYDLFIEAAKRYRLKLRLAQTHYEGNPIKFMYRKFVNSQIRQAGINYTDYFENSYYFLKKNNYAISKNTEIMLHPGLNGSGELMDLVDENAVAEWIRYLNQLG